MDHVIHLDAIDIEEPWATCQAILAPPSTHTQTTSDVAQNTHIQKLLLLINRLTDRDLDRRMAVHLKYQELEDEGTARALPSAGLMGFLYHLVSISVGIYGSGKIDSIVQVQIRPGLSDEYILDYLTKMQTIKVSGEGERETDGIDRGYQPTMFLLF